MTYSKAQLQEQAQGLFEKLNTHKLYATSDGQFFQNENRADLHAAGKMTVYPLFADGSTDKQLSDDERLMQMAKETIGKMTPEQKREQIEIFEAEKVEAEKSDKEQPVKEVETEAPPVTEMPAPPPPVVKKVTTPKKSATNKSDKAPETRGGK